MSEEAPARLVGTARETDPPRVLEAKVGMPATMRSGAGTWHGRISKLHAGPGEHADIMAGPRGQELLVGEKIPRMTGSEVGFPSWRPRSR